MLNFATYLFEGLEQEMPPGLECAGGGLLADMQLSTCYQFFNGKVLTQHAIGILIGGNIRMYTSILHGCRPASSYLTITKTEGPVICEINHKPALEVIDELLGPQNQLAWRDFALFITLGLNRGDKYGEFNEKDYANRLTLTVDENSKSLIMFEPDLKAGDQVQLMRRSVDQEYILKGVGELREKAGQSDPAYYFYINCAGRAKPYAGQDFEDAAEVQAALGNSQKMMGFYSGVEIAMVGSSLQPLDWTGVLCMFCEE